MYKELEALVLHKIGDDGADDFAHHRLRLLPSVDRVHSLRPLLHPLPHLHPLGGLPPRGRTRARGHLLPSQTATPRLLRRRHYQLEGAQQGRSASLQL